jgi:hypothetical protein
VLTLANGRIADDRRLPPGRPDEPFEPALEPGTERDAASG